MVILRSLSKIMSIFRQIKPRKATANCLPNFNKHEQNPGGRGTRWKHVIRISSITNFVLSCIIRCDCYFYAVNGGVTVIYSPLSVYWNSCF